MTMLNITALGAQAETTPQLLIEDFAEGADRRWAYVQDGVMGGVSSGQLSFETDGDTPLARLTGTVSTDNNGGFIQFRANLNGTMPQNSSGLRLRVKGNGESYYIFLRTLDMRRPWHSYRASFDTTEAWQNVDMLWDQFKSERGYMPPNLDPTKITGIGIVAYGRDFTADLSVAELHLLTQQDP